MQILSKGNFARKITTLVLLASGMALATLTAAFLAFDDVSSRAVLHDHLTTLADIVGQNSTAAITFNDRLAAREVLGALEAESPVVSACLYDSSGNVFAQYQRQADPASCPAKFAQLPPLEKEYSSVVRPVMRHDETIGTLFLQSDLQELQKRWRQLLSVVSALLLVALMVGGTAATFLQRRISRPISDLARAMHKVTVEQNFTARVSVLGGDEIAQLGSDFNTMLAELEQRDLAKKNAEAKLQHQALNDELTGLPNRRLLADRLAHSLAIAKRESQTLALLYIDLDGFKLVNDSLGHTFGDVLLGELSERLRSRVRESDTLARIGGDEFTVILANLRDIDDAAVVAQGLLEAMGAPFLINDHKITISASVGISVFPKDAGDPVDLLQKADTAMYAAKRNGKNAISYFTPELGSAMRERLNLETQLRGAIDRKEICVHYQPEFDVASHRLTRFEALARWFHPTLGTISPAKFIPIAEESGIIIPLGAFVMEQACHEAVKWQSLSPYPIQVAVNVSSIQFARDSFLQEVIGILERTRLEPHLLQIELTESVMLNGFKTAAEKMKRLKALGVSLAIDDFGTGYSCLSYLPTLPFNALKIDRAFVSELNVRPQSRAMVTSLIALAHNLGMRVIIEGIEKLDQLEMIRELGGNEVQGYLLGRPSADPVSQLLAVRESGGRHQQFAAMSPVIARTASSPPPS